MKNIKKWLNIGFWVPLAILMIFYLFKSWFFPLHDFSNSYFAAKLITHNNASITQNTLFDIYAFNSYAWGLGYKEVLIDYYLNSPFTLVAFLPFSFIENAYLAKLLFNIFSASVFIYTILLLRKSKISTENNHLFILLIPFVCLVPIKNGILFGQSYLLILSLLILFIYNLERNKQLSALTLLSFASLLKIFPFFYGIILLFNKQWKAILWGTIATTALFGLSIPIIGWQLWETYLFEILPNAFANNSTVNFQYNAQSIDVFLKTLFIYDPYYNPNAVLDSNIMYITIKWLVKAVIIGLAFSLSIKNKENIFKLLAIWVVTLFLLQSRTATYAQILWVIPAFAVYNSKMSNVLKAVFFSLLILVCNIPISKLQFLPLVFKFSRLWLTLIMSFVFYLGISEKPLRSTTLKALIAAIILTAPMNLKALFKHPNPVGEYVLQKNYFMIYDFKAVNGKLNYYALGKNGDTEIQTEITIHTIDTTSCTLEQNQIFLDGQQLTNNSAIKKKPILINENEVYYLSDFNSRRGAFTLKKINLNKPKSRHEN